MPRSPAPGRTRANDPDAMRRRVLDVAAAMFVSRGYHATGMHDIMREAGVTGGALYHHFPTKKSLGLAVIEERVAQQVEATWVRPVLSASTAAAGIQRAFTQIIAALDARGAVTGCPLNNLALELSAADPEFRQAIEKVFDGWRAAIAARLRATRGAKDTDADEMAVLVVASYSGAMAMAKAAQATAPLKACARQLARVMRLEPGTRRA
jgi:AcrR family transcriptional regulator